MQFPRSFRREKTLLSHVPIMPGLLLLALNLLLVFALPFPAKASENFGGIVVDIEPTHSSSDLRLLIDRVPLTSKGIPLCQKPSGRLVSVLAQNNVRRQREHSTFVVSSGRSDRLSGLLSVGDCLTVHGRRDRQRSTPDRNDIRIVSTLRGHTKNMRSFRAFFLKLWPDIAPRSSIRGPEKHPYQKVSLFLRSDGF